MRRAPATESAGVIAGRIGRPSANALFVPGYLLTDADQLSTDTENDPYCSLMPPARCSQSNW